MRQVFNYNKFNDEVADSIVETFAMLTQKSIEGKNNTPEYQEANTKLNETFMKFCVEAIPGKTFSSLEDVKNPMITRDVFFTQRFNTILAQAITPAVPTVIANGYQNLYDVTQVGWGENCRYTVDSNEMFIVSSMAEGIARGGVQTMLNTEYSVAASRKQVAIYVDWLKL